MWIPPRVSLLFELHNPSLWDGWGGRLRDGSTSYLEDLQNWDKTDIMVQTRTWPEPFNEISIPRAVEYPKENVLNYIGHNPYQTSQVSWMMSYAMYLGYSHISFYGIDLISEGEARSYQRHCLEYLIGLARGRGITVSIAKGSSLCKYQFDGVDKVYGWDYPKDRDDAVHVYGHPMRQVLKDKNGNVLDVREVPGLMGMPMMKKGKDGAESVMKVVNTMPESVRGMYQLAEKEANAV